MGGGGNGREAVVAGGRCAVLGGLSACPHTPLTPHTGEEINERAKEKAAQVNGETDTGTRF